MSKGLTAENGRPETGHVLGGTYDVQYQEHGSMEILDSDDDGNEFPAKPGWYYKQFVPARWAAQEWISVGGWFGPYESVSAMPLHVRANLTSNRPENK